MSEEILVLPAADCSRIRLVRIPEDIGNREAYRTVTGLIAQVEEIKPVVAEYLADTPLQDMLGFGGEFASSGTSGTGFEEEALVTPSTLMASARPVVRPGAE